MNIDSIQNGFVIDHIQAGKGMEIYRYLNLEELDCSVAIITNAKSSKSGKKDIIKIDQKINIDLTILGYLDPCITINVIENGTIVKKYHIDPPEKITNIISCKNPRCITSIEKELDQVFILTDKENKIYRCLYCETNAESK